MGNKNYKSSNKAKIVKNGLFKERRYKPNQLFARLKQKKRRISKLIQQFLENLKKLEVQAKKSIR